MGEKGGKKKKEEVGIKAGACRDGGNDDDVLVYMYVVYVVSCIHNRSTVW